MNRFRDWTTTAGALAIMLTASPALADRVGCANYQPGMLAFMTGLRPAGCAYQGDYMVKQGPTYDGPAVVAPQPTYAPTPSSAAYVYGPARTERVQTETRTTIVRRTAVKPVKRIGPKRPVVNVRSDLPPPPKGKPQIIRANAEVRIYGSERMDIRLYRR